MKIEIEPETQKLNANDHLTSNRKIQTIMYKSKIWVQDSIGPNKFTIEAAP